MSAITSIASTLRAIRVTYSNIISGLAATNVQDAIDELTTSILSGNFSFNVITPPRTIPINQQMIVHQEIIINSDLTIIGELVII